MPFTVTSATTASWTTWVTVNTTTSATTSTIWGSWNGGTATWSTNTATATSPEILSQLEADRAAREAAWEAGRAEREARQAERKAAEDAASERALETLRAVLNPEQWESWERERHFELITQAGRRYRIRRGVSGNVRLIEDGEEREALCAHPHRGVFDDERGYLGQIPVEDVVIAQVLALRTDEDGFRRTANITTIRPAA